LSDTNDKNRDIELLEFLKNNPEFYRHLKGASPAVDVVKAKNRLFSRIHEIEMAEQALQKKES